MHKFTKNVEAEFNQCTATPNGRFYCKVWPSLQLVNISRQSSAIKARLWHVLHTISYTVWFLPIHTLNIYFTSSYIFNASTGIATRPLYPFPLPQQFKVACKPWPTGWSAAHSSFMLRFILSAAEAPWSSGLQGHPTGTSGLCEERCGPGPLISTCWHSETQMMFWHAASRKTWANVFFCFLTFISVKKNFLFSMTA